MLYAVQGVAVLAAPLAAVVNTQPPVTRALVMVVPAASRRNKFKVQAIFVFVASAQALVMERLVTRMVGRGSGLGLGRGAGEGLGRGAGEGLGTGAGEGLGTGAGEGLGRGSGLGEGLGRGSGELSGAGLEVRSWGSGEGLGLAGLGDGTASTKGAATTVSSYCPLLP